jgi:hypothetical protein
MCTVCVQVKDSAAVKSDLATLRRIILRHCTTANSSTSSNSTNNSSSSSSSHSEQLGLSALQLEQFQAACAELGQAGGMGGFKLLSADPPLAQAVHSSLRYMVRRRRTELAAKQAEKGESAAPLVSIYTSLAHDIYATVPCEQCLMRIECLMKYVSK